MNVYKALQLSAEVSNDIKHLFKSTSYNKFNDLSYLQSDETPEERFIKTELINAFEHLEIALRKINYLNRDVIKTGRLHKNRNGRYELEGKEYTCSSTIEFIYYDDSMQKEEWIVSRIENANGRYFIHNFPEVELDNLLVRERALPELFE